MRKLVKELKEGLFSYEEATHGWIIQIKSAQDLLNAAVKVRDAGIKKFDCFSPFPIHGLEKAMGIKRSWLPLITLVVGLTGAALGFGGMSYISAIDWPLNVGGKPSFSWPAFIPITFEMTILLGGLSTVAGVIILGKLYKPNRKPITGNISSDGFAVWIGDGLKEEEVKGIFNGLDVKVEPVSVAP